MRKERKERKEEIGVCQNLRDLMLIGYRELLEIELRVGRSMGRRSPRRLLLRHRWNIK